MAQATNKKQKHKVNAAGGESPLGDIKGAIAVCSFEINSASSEVQLTPVGRFRALDGRPHDAEAWYIDGEIAARLIPILEARKNPYIIDYEHQTLLSEKNGQPAPRAAAFRRFEWREGVGLFAIDVQWTPRAKKYFDDDEYGYVSPVFPYRKGTGEVLGFLHAALTNDPAVDGMEEVAAIAAAKFNSNPQEDNLMDREQLIADLGLSADASDADVSAAIAALKAKVGEAATQGETIAALKASQFDPAQHIDLATFEETKAELATLKEENLDNEIEALVSAGMKDGRLLPNQDKWARKLGASDIAALKQYLDDANPVAALKGNQTKGKKPEGTDGDALSESELAVCKATGVKPEDFKKNKGGSDGSN